MAQQESTLTIQHIPFHDDELLAVVDERTGKEYVLPKPMVDMFGLSWQGQLAKLKRSKLFSKGINMTDIPSAGGMQQAVLLERRLVHAWLLSIDVSRVAAAYQDKVLRYQEECAEVLDAYFTKGVALNPRTRGDLLVEMAEAYRDQERRLLALEAQERARDREVIATQAKTIEALQLATRANTKADMALDDAHRMSIEAFVLKNGLLRQCPVSRWKEMSAWLGEFCRIWGLDFTKTPVPGKMWADEFEYPLPAFGAWWRHELSRARQIALVTPIENADTP